MIDIPASIQTFQFAGTNVKAYIPSQQWVEEEYAIEHPNAPVPYWAQVWPAAKALCEVIATEPALIANKVVLEIAAGLGLPSLLAAQLAKEVIASDYIPEAVELMKRSADENGWPNMQCRVMDWNKLDKKLQPDLLLLSDVNYDPVAFDTLYKLLVSFIQKGTTVLLSTPQRLVAKSFMDRLEPWCAKKHNIDVSHKNETVFASVWVLKDSKK
jgi:predicted nicotinamide N-methyase